MSLSGNAKSYNPPQDREQTIAAPAQKTSAPAFKEYRGVRIGMAATEVREKLGKPKVKDKSQDLYVFSENESAQVFYDTQEKVFAVSVDFTGRNSVAPTPKEVLNEEVVAKADGSMYRMKQYSDAGYWVSYNRSSSDPPQVTITMQKIN
jgi:hypothetical protein